ncbi:HNH endonuclease [Parafrankia discariae]|uniref:HNH endonuclease n=1 Tax=Parafrankia discariae TaxID=365528 RepID=UPI0003712105|nr:HNH endonuclease signature motif containing protein [Parafrankia discariae]
MSAPRDQFAEVDQSVLAVAEEPAVSGSQAFSVFFERRRAARQLVLDVLVARDGQRCQGCGYLPPDPGRLEIDHVLPRALGGTDTVENFQLLCRRCNRRKGHLRPDQWHAALARDSVAVMAALRVTMAAAAAVRPRIPSVEHAVLAAVVARVTAAMRLWDDVYVADIAVAAGVVDAAGEPDTKETGRRLRALRDRGLVVYEPSSIRGRPSRLGLHTAGTAMSGGGDL